MFKLVAATLNTALKEYERDGIKLDDRPEDYELIKNIPLTF
jgi:6-phospho-beta-glucosidase